MLKCRPDLGPYAVSLAVIPGDKLSFTAHCRAESFPGNFKPLKKLEKWLRPEASWRQMQIFCIKDTKLSEVVCRYWDRFDRFHCDNIHWDIPDKATLGDLVDWLNEQSECPDHENRYRRRFLREVAQSCQDES